MLSLFINLTALHSLNENEINVFIDITPLKLVLANRATKMHGADWATCPFTMATLLL